MVTIYVIDNGGQWTHREWRVLKYLDVETKIVPNTAAFSDISDVDGIVLSGGAPRIGIETTLGNCREYLEKATYNFRDMCRSSVYGTLFWWLCSSFKSTRIWKD